MLGDKEPKNKMEFAVGGFIQISYTYLYIRYPHILVGNYPKEAIRDEHSDLCSRCLLGCCLL